MPEAPRQLAVIFGVGVAGRRFVGLVFSSADACLQDLRRVSLASDPGERDRDVVRRGAHLNDARARRRVALQMRTHEVRTRRQIAKDEVTVSIGDRERAGASERRNDDAGERLRMIVHDRAAEFGGGQRDELGNG